jgi:ferredoxin--NADP+ reductase
VTQQLGTEQRPVRIAIIGAGPSGFYAAGALFAQKDIHVTVDMFDRLPAPYGLVRYGVAPDHEKIKAVTKMYDRTAANPRFRFFGNVTFGVAINHAELRQHYDQIVYAVGAQSDRRLNIPGEELAGSLSATEFVAWYNAHPYFADLEVDLSCDAVAVVGVGNVAMDVARILAKNVAELKTTDIADYALARLAQSNIQDIYVLSRRGPAQVKFTNPEIKEFGELENVDVVVRPEELELDPLSAVEIANDAVARKNLEILREYAQRPLRGRPRRVHFRFLVSPVEIQGDEAGRVAAIRLERNELQPGEGGDLRAHGTGQFESLPVGMVLRSVGYKGLPLENVPYDQRTGIIPNQGGRVIDPKTGDQVGGEYVVGWAKRGPTGVIGTNKPDAAETVQNMLADVPHLRPAPLPQPEEVLGLLEERAINYITMDGWRILDALEVSAGAAEGRPRVKLVHIQEMLDALDAALALPV